MLNRLLVTGAVVSIIGASVLTAQPPDLKSLLGLSDGQIQNLLMIQQQKSVGIQPLVQKLAQDRQMLGQLVASNPDPAVVGKLFLEIAALSHQIQVVNANVQQQSLNVLQPAQRNQVNGLQEALQLQVAAQQALALGLVLAPN